MPLIVRLALVFAAGAVAGNYLSEATGLIVASAVAAAPLLWFAAAREQLLLPAIAVMGIGLGALNAARVTAGCSRIADGAAIEVVGFMETTLSEERRTVTLRKHERLNRDVGTPLCGAVVRVRINDAAPRLRMGDAVRVSGRWMAIRVGEHASSMDGLVIADDVATIAVKPHGLLRIRGETQQAIHSLFPAMYPLAEALLIAQRENLNPEVRESFAASGLTHLLAISGTHVALVAASLLLIARLLRCPRTVAAAVSIAGSAAYVFFLGAPHAALRALIQMILVVAAQSMQRPAHPLGLLATAAAIITAIDPAAPLDAGFQLSFAGICGIVLWRRPLIDLLPASLPLPLRDAIATTVAATATTTPIAAFHFGVVSAIALLANLLAIPVVSIAVPTAAVAVVVSKASAELAGFIAAGAELPLFWLNRIAQLCAAVPGGHFSVTPIAIVTSTIAVALSFRALRERYRSTARGRIATAALAGALPIIVLPLLPLASAGMQIHMIDVGQGDAFAVRTPRGRWLLVDAGPISEKFDAGKRNVLPFLLRHQAARLEAVILSHPHLDHFGGLPAVAAQMKVRAVIDPMLPVPSPTFDSLLAVAQRQQIPWLVARPGTTVRLDGVTLDFLGPATSPVDASIDPNDYSATFRLSYGDFSALFLGDLPAGGERLLVDQFGPKLDVDLLKVAHHGSNGSSSTELLVATSPRVALISAGRRNRYGHPGRRVLAQLEAAGIKVFRSDRDGSVTVDVDARGQLRVSIAQ